MSMFKVGDKVVFKYNYQPHLLMTIEAVLDGGRFVGVDGYRQAFAAKDFRHATTQETQANKRFNHIVEPNDMVDDAHIENHISPLCKTESQPVLIVERDNQIIERLKVENVVLQAKVDELQKRVDAALQLVNEMKGKRYPFSAYADQLEQALKGDSNG